MRHGAELDHKSGRAKVVDHRPVALLACEQNSRLELRDGALAVGLPKRNQANTGIDQIGDVALQESR
jgi:hypothetical protein